MKGDNYTMTIIFTLLSALLAVVGTLIFVIGRLFWGKLKEVEGRLIAHEEKHREDVRHLYQRIDDAKKDINDLDATVSGFPGIYLTRKEFNEWDIATTRSGRGKR